MKTVSSLVVVSISSRPQWLNDIHTDGDNWATKQRWRSVTAKAVFTMNKETSIWNTVMGRLSDDIHSSLQLALRISNADTADLHGSIEEHLWNVHGVALELSAMSAIDMVSVRMSVVLGMDNPEFRDVLRPEYGYREGDNDIADYSLGLIKIDQAGRTTVLLRPQVATTALLRHAPTLAES
jgi:hypothetical protein